MSWVPCMSEFICEGVQEIFNVWMVSVFKHEWNETLLIA